MGDTRIQIYKNALKKIAAFDDAIGCEHLAATGSYGAFDEPASVANARKALNETDAKLAELEGGK